MKNISLFLILVTSLSFGQTNTERQFNKIILDTERRIGSQYSEYGINNQLWSQYFSETTKGEIISLYTTSNISFCHLKAFSFFKSKKISIQEAEICNEPPEIAVTEILYNYRIDKNHLKISNSEKSILDLKIISIEEYEQEKFGKNSYKLIFSVE